jgi:hypothetical protein
MTSSAPKRKSGAARIALSAPARLLMRRDGGLDHDELAFYFLRGSSAGST